MSDNEKKIREVLAEVGSKRTDHEIHYEPIRGPALEMCGHEGGWMIDGDPVGYSVDEVVAHIRDCPTFFNDSREGMLK